MENSNSLYFVVLLVYLLSGALVFFLLRLTIGNRLKTYSGEKKSLYIILNVSLYILSLIIVVLIFTILYSVTGKGILE